MSLGRNATYNVVGQVLPLIVSLTAVPLYLHLVGVERYGVLAIAWMLLGYFGMFDLGLTRALLQRIASLRDSTPEARAQAFWTAVIASGIMAVVGAVLMYGVGHWYITGPFQIGQELRQEAVDALPLLALVLPLGIIWGVLNGALLGRERFLEFNAISVVTTVAAQLAPIAVALLHGPRLSGLLGASLVVQLVALVVSFLFCLRYVTEGHRAAPSRGEAVALFRYGGWITVSASVAPLMSLLDRFLIGSLANAAAVATYAVPAQLAQRLNIIPNSLSNALFPKLSAEQNRAHATAVSHTSTRAAGAIMAPLVIGGICLMGPFLALWLRGALGRDAVTVGQILLIGWWLNGLAASPFTLLQADGRPRATGLLHLAELPAYCALLWCLTLMWGAVGAALAFSIRCAIDSLAMHLLAFGRRLDLVVFALPTALMIVAVPLVGALPISPLPLATAAAAIAISSGWAWRVVPPSVRQSLIGRASFLLRRRHA
ncbi:O-antigen/teichoic acid export membrane protein [Sphingomonas jinjuensis]|uniref:O-antigen/teichoic acid export membrane protein n=1 Tax=Sphingomonas jinjuensis TaxID=535907 RepID=A0A840FHF0_9SPHN|nr:oligosaccharide flippase family protein [Sphingomonas jinjuensis]MBB4155144.1 O-antigen/teichoic acid export membrane protein [Sphingomonas jinjuensis]